MPLGDDAAYFRPSLPPSMPVVRESVESLLAIMARQRLFLSTHADALKMELEEELATANAAGSSQHTPPAGEWRLCGFRVGDDEVLDLVRVNPDALSNLEYVEFTQTGLLAKISSFFKFGSKQKRDSLDVSSDLAYALSTGETVEIVGHVLGAVSRAMTEDPKMGRPIRRELAFELFKSRHRGTLQSMYLLMTLDHAKQNAANNRIANTLHAGVTLYLHTPGALGANVGVAVDVSGEAATDDFPSIDMDAGELKRMFQKKAVFCASATSNFFLRPDTAVTSQRAAKIASVTTTRLVDASNAALQTFFQREAAVFADQRRSQKKKLEQEMDAARKEAEEAAKAAALAQKAERMRLENVQRLESGEETAIERMYAAEDAQEEWW